MAVRGVRWPPTQLGDTPGPGPRALAEAGGGKPGLHCSASLPAAGSGVRRAAEN